MFIAVNLSLVIKREERAVARFMAPCWGNMRMDWIVCMAL